MRKEVKDLARGIADDLLEHLEWITIGEIAEGYGLELTEAEYKGVYYAVIGARTTLDPFLSEQIERLQGTVRKLSNVSGIDLSEIMDEGYLTEDDLG